MRTWVALLRGINVGGHRKVSMPALREALADAGFENVRTYVNSGNVVLESSLAFAAKVSGAVHDVISDRLGMDVSVLVRTGPELAAVLAWNPFPEAAESRPQLVNVVHLAARPPAAKVRELLAADVSPDRLAARGSEVVVAYARSSQRSPTERPLRKLGIEGTARNWRTLAALVELAGQP
jgi:uncharacterized protein (DUF1697 family)